ncbi:TonB-dependent receptor [Tahibacter amnicola]|uniref:TonB-dependent receptor n=1 Tax=Tahibacter amnicola TaxID=2976241 RepID=A0ABY6BHJ1_9GAMM|nr:TonB-dependent receptor [Tahibacter amnicola]UXI69484.1 TonB-dependent receptor [Tahibacter amnicola]
MREQEMMTAPVRTNQPGVALPQVPAAPRSIARRATLALAVCATVAGVPPMVHAEPLAETRLSAIDVDEVNGEAAKPGVEAASAGIVTAADLRVRPLSRPAEVLEVMPGLVATQHSGNGKGNQYFLRGFNLDHGTDLSTTIDGVPNNLRTHGHGQGYNDLNGLIPELIRRIEYRKGPYAADDGDFSSAGAAHIRYVDKVSRPFVDVTAGEHGFARVLAAGSGEFDHDRSLLLGVDLGRNDGPWEKPEDARRASVIAKFRQGNADTRWGIAYLGYRNRWASSDQVPLRAVESGRIGRFGQIDPDLGGDTSRHTLVADVTHATDTGEWQANAYAVRYRLDLFSNFTYLLEHPDEGDQFAQADDRTYYGGALTYSHRWTSGEVLHELATGAELRIDDIDRVGLYHTRARQTLGVVRQDQVAETSAGLHASLRSQWTSTFHSVVGLRGDYYDADVDSLLSPNSGAASQFRASPKFSLMYSPVAPLALYANAGRGFHSNDARGATTRVNPLAPSEPAQPLDLIVPTRGEEVGIRYAPVPNLMLSAVFWRLRIGSELVFSGDGGSTEASRASRRQGIEAELTYRPLPWLRLEADFARSQARFTEFDPAGDAIPGAIEKVASVGIYVDHGGRWSGGLRYRYLGPAPLVEDGSVRSRSTTLVNLDVNYAISTNAALRLEVHNLLDSDDNDITYFYESRMTGETDPVADIHFHPVEPRTVRLSWRYTF